MGKDSLTITDSRTGKTYTVPIEYGTAGQGAISALAFKEIGVSSGDGGLLVYDSGFRNTASCRSAITFVDGASGILRHRGYPIDQLSAQSTFLEVAYLLLNGELPTQTQYDAWCKGIARESMIHESIKNYLQGFDYDAHTMGMLVGVLGALSTFYPDARELGCQRFTFGMPEVCDLQAMDVHIWRLIGKIPTIAAYGYRHSRGLPYIYPDPELAYIPNLIHMLFGVPDQPYKSDPVIERALDVLFVLHADHEQSCSTTAMRTIGSTQADPYSAVAGAVAALYGPLHGGANELVLQMLKDIGKKEQVPAYLERVKAGRAPLPGFGHRLYQTPDPRVSIVKKVANDVFEVKKRNPLMDIALEIERLAADDEFFVSRKAHPNTEFFSGIVYQTLGLPLDMMSVLFAIPRAAGWLANWKEMLRDEDQRLYRPRQIYVGKEARAYVPMEKR